MNLPKVSVIIPTYNRAHLLPRAINSVLKQTFQDFEIIVVDDGSTDNTREVVGGFKNEKIVYLKHDKNKGLSAARNTGIKNSKGEYVAFLDSDDEWLPEKLKEQLRVFTKSAVVNLGIVGCDIFLVLNNQIKERVYNYQKDVLNQFLHGNFFHGGGSAALIKKKVFNEIGLFDENLDIYEDWDIWIRTAQRFDFDFVRQALVKYYIHNESISRDRSNQGAIRRAEGMLKVLEKHTNLFDKYSKLKARQLKGIALRNLGTINLLLGNRRKAREYFIKSAKTNPSLRNILTFLLFLISKDLYIKILNIKRKLYYRKNDSSKSFSNYPNV